MQARIVVLLLLLVIGMAPLRAQEVAAGESVDSNESTDTSETITTSTTSTVITTSTSSIVPTQGTPPGWINLVRISALAGPIAFLALAWFIAGFVHHRLVRREQAQFPVVRGTRTPQVTPMIISAALLFVPAVLFVFYEIRSRHEMSLGIGGIVDEWQPVDTRAWTTLLVCLVLALIPWLLARRADTVS